MANDSDHLTPANRPDTYPPAGRDDPAALLESLTRVVRLVYFRAANRTEMLDLPIAQMRCLNALGEREGDRLVELAGRTSLTLPAASRTVEKLVQKGLVLRQPDPDDRRAVRLFLSETGSTMLDRLRAARLAHLTEAARGLSPQEMADLQRSLTLLADSASEQGLGPPYGPP